MTVDLNTTIGPWPRADAPALTAQSLLAELDSFGVSSATVRHSDAIYYDAATGNATLSKALAGHSRLLPAYVVGPLDAGEHGGVAGFREHLDRAQVAALWLYPASHGWSLTGPEADSLLAELAQAGRPILIELDEAGWSAIDRLAERLPDTDIVVCATGYRTLRQAFAVLHRRPRVHLDTSYLSAADGLEIIAERFGAQRLVFASGTPVRDAGGAHERLRRSGLTRADQQLVRHDNALRLLGLADPPHPQRSDVAPDGVSLDVVDAHAHIGRWPTSWVPRPHPEDLIALMASTGTAISIVSSMDAIWTGDIHRGNAAAIDAAVSHPGRIFVHAVANPHRPADASRLTELLSTPQVRGIKIHPHTHDCAADDARYDWIYELAAGLHRPVLVHTFAGTWHSDLELLGRAALRHPDVTMLAGHTGATTAGFQSAVDLAARVPNLYAEICGSVMTGWWLSRLVRAFGADRVLYGTDSTLIDPRYGLGRVLHAGLPARDRDLVLSGNARRLYQLPLHP